MKFVNTKRSAVVSRFKGKEFKYPYFFYEEDPYAEEYSKFVLDDLYADGNVDWYYIVNNNVIVGVCALLEDGEELWIKFLEIDQNHKGEGLGSEAVDYIINASGKQVIRLFPKNEELGDKFYKCLGFKWFGDGEMYYLNWGEAPNATN